MKSYGRAPTFLLLTGYEQARSIAAALAGDWEAAREVQLTLPETGVCSSSYGDGACCTPSSTSGSSQTALVTQNIPTRVFAGKALSVRAADNTGGCCD
jgi:hypothetical protein